MISTASTLSKQWKVKLGPLGPFLFVNNIVDKIIPIKFEREFPIRSTKIVEWRLGNICNFNCSFCPSIFKDGSKRYLDFKKYTEIVDNLISSDTSKKVWFQFTGGEPTLYPKLIHLLNYIKDRGGYTSMISNGSRSLRWWRELADSNILDRLYLTYHPEQEDSPDHIIKVNEIIQSTNTLVTIFVTAQAQEDLFDKAIQDHKKILKDTITISSLKPINDEKNLQPYTNEQSIIIQENLYVRSTRWKDIPLEKIKYLKTVPWYTSDMTMQFSDGSSKKESAQYFVEHNLTQFKGWECSIGKDMLIIEIDQVFRGMCNEGGPVSNLNFENIFWQTTDIICQKDHCICSLDVQEPKKRP
jgi:organic radical activating enzyme